jgi:hypothetical protein
MTYPMSQFGFLPRLLFELHSSLGKSVGPLAPTPSPRRALGPFHFYIKGGEKILCNLPDTLPKVSPDNLSAPIFRVQRYILSEHKFGCLPLNSQQFYPIFALILKSCFNQDIFAKLFDWVYRRAWFFIYAILLLFGYKKIPKEEQDDQQLYSCQNSAQSLN